MSVSRLLAKAALSVSGIDLETGECLNLIPHPSLDQCRQFSIFPGSILSGLFSPLAEAEAPHIEDSHVQNLTFERRCTADEFRGILAQSAAPSIEQGLGMTLEDRQKFVTREMGPARSLLTIAVPPMSVEVVQDGFGYSPSNIKAHFTDRSGKEFTYLPVADTGFHSYAENHYRELSDYHRLNELIHTQEEMFLRVGLSRFHEAPSGRAGFWLQITGLYGFPAFFEEAREHV